MTEKEQIYALTVLRRQIADQIIKEAQPSKWHGHGQESKEMGEKTSALRLMDKKQVTASHAVFNTVDAMLCTLTGSKKEQKARADAEDVSAIIAKLEREAKNIVYPVQ